MRASCFCRSVKLSHMIAHQNLLDLLYYNPETGAFVWKVRTGGRTGEGKAAGSTRRDGYHQVIIRGRPYLSHRLAWIYMTGEWPSSFIDHKDGIRNNNQWANLRLATRAQNGQNMRIKRVTASGLKGVTPVSKSNKFQARIRADGKSRNLGCFDTAEEAHEAYMAKALELFGEFANHG